MYELKNIVKVFTRKFVGTGPLSYKKIIYRAAVSQKLRNTDVKHNVTRICRQMFEQYYSIKFPVEPSCTVQTDTQTDLTKLIVAFCNFANTPKAYQLMLCM